MTDTFLTLLKSYKKFMKSQIQSHMSAKSLFSS